MGVQYYKSGFYIAHLCFYVGEIIPISFIPNKQSHSSVLESVFLGIFSIGLEKEERKTLVPLCDCMEILKSETLPTLMSMEK